MVMGGRRRASDETLPPVPKFPSQMPVSEPCSGRVGELLTTVRNFCNKKRRYNHLLVREQQAIRAAYENFTPAQRVELFSALYDIFAERYDRHMSKTGHYRAIARVMQYGMPHLRAPILDITAGTGEPLRYALEYMRDAEGLRFTSLDLLRPDMKRIESDFGWQACANEISTRMLDRARAKLQGGWVGFTSFNALSPPKEMNGRFATVLCSQTFHLISNSDKQELASAIHRVLAPGGIAMVIEEDPFRITKTDEIEEVRLVLSSVVDKMRNIGVLIALFEKAGFRHCIESAIAPIDDEHQMHLHLFEKI